ncbi:MAG: cyclase family protein [Clostridia bacterium]|nr:cyclase family protein [Clostridia bacterium]
MRIIDISQEILNCNVYPGDPAPHMTQIADMAKGDLYNLTTLSICNHNGTHVDAPKHFFENGISVDQIPLDIFVGECFVARHTGDVLKKEAEEILSRAGKTERLLIAGDATVTEEAAIVFRDAGIKLIGNESQTVGPKNAPMAVHKILLGAEIVLLEGVVLDGVEEGQYWLNAAPICIKGAEGAPVRAYLIER